MSEFSFQKDVTLKRKTKCQSTIPRAPRQPTRETGLVDMFARQPVPLFCFKFVHSARKAF